jgi:transcriptional regulator with XRE-family HTH domain
MIERILEIMKIKNLSPSQFADEIGIQRSGISHLITGRNKPSLEFVLKVLKRYPDIKPEWLLQGFATDASSDEPDEGSRKINQKTLFDESDEGSRKVNQKTLFEESDEGSKKINQKILSDEQEMNESSESRKVIRSSKKEKNERKIEKIVIFYQDKTFREYEPE